MPIETSILERCPDPYATRRRADRGLDVPCLTGCMAFEPGIDRECYFVNRRIKIPHKPFDGPRVSPLRGRPDAVVQLMLPTSVVMQGPGPEQETPNE